jgi:hypothetical protein
VLVPVALSSNLRGLQTDSHKITQLVWLEGPPTEMAADLAAKEANTAIHMWVRECELWIKASLSEHLYECSSCLNSKGAADKVAKGANIKAPDVACSAARARAKHSVHGAADVNTQSAGRLFRVAETAATTN